jgi:hypothetical protein
MTMEVVDNFLGLNNVVRDGVVVQSSTGYNERVEEGGRIQFQVVEDELFGEEIALQPVPLLRRHPWVEVGFDFLAVEVLLVVEVRVVVGESVVRVTLGSGLGLRRWFSGEERGLLVVE